MAGQVAQALDVALGRPQKAALEERPTTNAAAYDAFLKGEAQSVSVGTSDAVRLRASRPYYEQAVALDSGFAQAWTQLSRAHSLIYVNGSPSQESAQRALEAAERARRIAPNHFQGYLAMGDYYASIPLDYPRAIQEYESGLRIAPRNADLLSATALAELSIGRWEEALQHLTRAETLDPRAAAVVRRLAYTYLRLRRLPEALAASDRAIALAPENVTMFENKVMVYLAQGDLDRARQTVAGATGKYDLTALASNFGIYYDLYWVLQPELQELLVRLTPSAFDDRATWAIVRAQALQFRGDGARARVYADSARLAFEERIRNTPDDAQSHIFRGLALAYLGRKAEAIAEGEKGVALLPIAKDGYIGPTCSTSSSASTSWSGSLRRRSTGWSRCSRCPTISRPAGSGWIRTSIRCGSNPRFRKLVEGTP